MRILCVFRNVAVIKKYNKGVLYEIYYVASHN